MKRKHLSLISAGLVLFFLPGACSIIDEKKGRGDSSIEKRMDDHSKKIETLSLRLARIIEKLEKQEKRLNALKQIRGRKQQGKAKKKYISDTVEKQYKNALNSYYQNQLPQAILKFQSIKNHFPKHELSIKSELWIRFIKKKMAGKKKDLSEKKEYRFSPDQAYNTAVEAYNEKRYNEAMLLFHRFLRDWPDHPHAKQVADWAQDIKRSLKKRKAKKQRPKRRISSIRRYEKKVTKKKKQRVVKQIVVKPDKNKRVSKSADQISGQTSKAKKLYSKGMNAFNNRRYQKARAFFNTLVKKYPRHYLADNALYWAGECLYSQNNFYEAVVTFKEVIKRYPAGNKLPDALLKASFAYLALDDPENARLFLDEVIRKYPNTAASDKAKNKLRSINKRKEKLQDKQPKKGGALQVNFTP
ncbi:tol-pal system protein YbgF [Desulfobacterales bacterium HSG16]|nr:tol-pal system protein YbgF [Desulfobacterales bacterium HSG16]